MKVFETLHAYDLQIFLMLSSDKELRMNKKLYDLTSLSWVTDQFAADML